MQPAATATCQGCPSAIAASAITATVAPTCRPPSPKSLLRKRQSMPGASSSPTKKQHHHHAEFGHMLDFLRFTPHQPQRGADNHARQQIAEHRAQTQTF